MDRDGFIESWGRLGSLWGLNPTTARIHALLLSSDEDLSLTGISDRLGISRGNASMCLKELRGWHVVQQVKRPGDRQDWYRCEPDVWRTFFAIARGRKHRELDPALAAVREAVAGTADEGPAVTRVREFAEFLATLGRIADRLLASEEQARHVIAFLSEEEEL